jgi:uncharacterized membrane protein YvbJ
MFCPNCGKETPPEMQFCGSCGYDITGTVKKEPKAQKFEFSQLSAITVIYTIIMCALSIIGTVGIGIIAIILWYFISVYAINNMTYKVKGSVNWAFAIIMTFGLIGYICYWIWFLNKRNSMVE